LRALVVPTGVYAASSDWGATEQGQQALGERVERAANELADLVLNTGKTARRAGYGEPVPFEQLLAGRTGEA
jgi:FMN reductase